jgi:hypothetical protein
LGFFAVPRFSIGYAPSNIPQSQKTVAMKLITAAKQDQVFYSASFQSEEPSSPKALQNSCAHHGRHAHAEAPSRNVFVDISSEGLPEANL